MEVLSDIEIARRNEMAPIEDIAQKINLNPEGLIKFGNAIAKSDTDKAVKDSGKVGKLILVTAISPTLRAKARQQPLWDLMML